MTWGQRHLLVNQHGVTLAMFFVAEEEYVNGMVWVQAKLWKDLHDFEWKPTSE